MLLSLLHRLPPVLRALLAQGLAFAGVLLLARLLSLGVRGPLLLVGRCVQLAWPHVAWGGQRIQSLRVELCTDAAATHSGLRRVCGQLR